MPTFYKPGTRKGNRTYVVRGSVSGREYEITTDTTNKRTAQGQWDRFARAARQHRDLPPTFGRVADMYMQAKQSSANDQRYIERLKAAYIPSADKRLEEIPIKDVRRMHIDEAASSLYPKGAASTKNRQAYVPAASILHYAAENELRDYIVVRKLREDDPESRRPLPGTGKALLGNTDGIERAFLAVLFYQGFRVTETLSLDWSRIDLRGRTIALYVSKAKRQKAVAMHPETRKALAPHVQTSGKVFPWKDRHAVYRWLRPLCKRLGVTFTPHMARHDFGSGLEEAGATPGDLVKVGSWTSEKSTARYRHTSDDHARSVLGRRKV